MGEHRFKRIAKRVIWAGIGVGVVIGALVLGASTTMASAVQLMDSMVDRFTSQSFQSGNSLDIGYDPLSTDEQIAALQIALSDSSVQAEIQDAERTETLLVERYEEEKDVYDTGSWDRRADVFIYVYDRDVTVQAIVNLTTDTVDAVRTEQEIQLPLTAAESALALQIARADARVEQALQDEYLELTGQPLDPDAPIGVAAGTYSYDPDQESPPSTLDCGLHRCAQLLLTTPEEVAFNLVPIIDLSTLQVVFVGNEEAP